MDKPPGASARKAKALFLSAEAPYPLAGGGQMRSASLLEGLARHYAVHAVVFHQPTDPHPALDIPADKVDRLDVLELPFRSRRSSARLLRNVGRLLRGTPPLMDRFAGFGDRIAAAISGQYYDVAIIEHFWCAPYLEQVRPHAARVLLDLHNIESVWHETLAASAGPASAWALRRFATASVALERKWLPEFEVILATSVADAGLVRDVAGGAKVAVYPNALPEMPAPPRQEREEIVFSGNLEYAPNVSAVRFFNERIWPALQARWPNLRWRIMGKNPHGIARLVRGDARIDVTGAVNDAVTELAQAQVAVVPLLAGSGTRVKILEAWAAGTAVVSSTLGAAGLEARDGEHLLLADDPDRFSEAVSSLLADPRERARVGAAGRRLYEEHYTWPAAWRRLDSILGNGTTADTI
jgi:glycosyltransferase involved in cell wall biosynthesis